MYNPKNLSELYSGADLATLFKGNFINFGYWKDLSKHLLSPSDVIEANKQLYLQVFQRLAITEQDNILELGSGHGGGCALLCHAYSLPMITGIDFLKSHVSRSNDNYASLVQEGRIRFIQGEAESIPLSENSVSKIYTVEAFQHFDPQYTIPELKRILLPEGRLVISTFFTKDKALFSQLLELLPRPALLPDRGSETFSALPDVLKLLEDHSFKNISVENISDYVWPGYDKWVKQNEPGIWDEHWSLVYEKGLVDYYIITADR